MSASLVFPAQAGTQKALSTAAPSSRTGWIPAFAGMTAWVEVL
jgi:hypothetical protein